MADFTARDGATISDGEQGTFELAYGAYAAEHERLGMGKEGDPVVVEVTGTVRQFDQVERVYDEEGIAVGKTTEQHWEITTGDAQHPAVGFLPENVLTKKG